IGTIPDKIAQMQKAGYVVMASFILPETCWIDNFFGAEITAQKIFLDKYRGNKSAEEFVKYEKRGAELYKKYKEYYGYVFYIGKKI
ncbi:MAG TPA: SAM-dependent methyltransferase, partial [Spirochaetota bacterium]|nr:SAM-dependent methyltransferase [Spirochaetota bacterium]